MSREEKIKFDADVEAKIKEIDSTMALEGMRLPDKFKETLRQCLNGTTSTEKERQKILDRYKRIYG